jgi:hypothetical protein
LCTVRYLDKGLIIWNIFYDLSRHAALTQQHYHAPHGREDVLEEELAPGAEVIQAGFSIQGFDEAVARAFAVAGSAD